MSDTTTPKRNEAVARYAPGWTEGSDNIYMHEVPNGNYVRHSDYAALQGEVSRLREALAEANEGTKLYEGHPGQWAELLTNLEPPTDGR